jgi:WD domain, G-beta repeat
MNFATKPTLELVRELPAGNVDAVAISNDGRWIAVAGHSSLSEEDSPNCTWFLELYDRYWQKIELLDPVESHLHRGIIRSINFTENSDRLITVSQSNSEDPSRICVWNLDDLSAKFYLDCKNGTDERVTWSVVTHPNGQTFFTGNDKGIIQHWSIESAGKPLMEWQADNRWVRCLVISKDGKYLYSCGSEDGIPVWDTDTYSEVMRFEGRNTAACSLTLSPDEKWLVSGGIDHRIKIWDNRTGKLVRSFYAHGHFWGFVTALVITPDSKYLISTGDTKIKIWDLETGAKIDTIIASNLSTRSIALSKDGRILISGSYDRIVKIWEYQEISTASAVTPVNTLSPPNRIKSTDADSTPEITPCPADAVLGGQAPPPVNAAVLGGLAGVRQRLESESSIAKIRALNDAIEYGDRGVDLAIQALSDPAPEIRRLAIRLLRTQAGEKGKEILLDLEHGSYFTTLHDWHVETYNPEIGIIDPENNAYVVTLPHSHEMYHYDLSQFQSLVRDPKISEMQGLIFLIQSYHRNFHLSFAEVMEAICDASHLFSNLKALYIGGFGVKRPKPYQNPLKVFDIGPFLEAFTNLEVLHIFGNFYRVELECDGLRHNNLKTLIIEAADLTDRHLESIASMHLPNLEYLQLWLGNNERQTPPKNIIQPLKPILSDNATPKLKYLGLCAHEGDTDSLINDLLSTPLMSQLAVLNFESGNITDRGAHLLHNCPHFTRLKLLTVINNSISPDTLAELQMYQ